MTGSIELGEALDSITSSLPALAAQPSAGLGQPTSRAGERTDAGARAGTLVPSCRRPARPRAAPRCARPRRAGRRRRRRDGHHAAGPRPAPWTTSRGYEGCNEILNVTRPDVVRARPRRLLRGRRATPSRPTPSAPTSPTSAEYGIADRIHELAAGRRPDRPRGRPTAGPPPSSPRFVLGSIGPGTKLPTLGHAPYAALRDAYQAQAAGPDRRRRRRAPHRDLPGPAAGQGRGRRAPGGR